MQNGLNSASKLRSKMAVKEQMMRRFSERVAEATPGGQNATPFGELVIHGHSLVENLKPRNTIKKVARDDPVV